MELHQARKYRLQSTATFLIAAAGIAIALGSGCTGSPGKFHLQQQNEVFDTSVEVSTKIDLLWVVDNSASMDVAQQKLREGFGAFARKYMLPTWDIRVAVITSDAYLAHPAFSTYLNTTVPGSVNYQSAYIQSRIGTWVNPSWNPTLVDGTGRFTGGIKYKEIVPGWGPNWARLLPGLHDGPVTAICSEFLLYFLNGATNCRIRDDQTGNTGPSRCLNPSGAETGPTQCVNTIQNDSIHSGKAIIETTPPSGTAGDQAWVDSLVSDFVVNLSVGSAGHGSERPMQSVLQLLADNEGSATKFFRPGSLRAIIFVTDEEDQTQAAPAAPPAGFNPYTGYACDQAGIVARNTPAHGQPGGTCCAGGSCLYGSGGTTCPSKTIDGYTFTSSTCVPGASLKPVADIKNELDAFFTALDGGTADGPNYFTVAITPLTGQSVQDMQADRDADDIAAGVTKMVNTNRADRVLELGTLVGNGSISMDIAADDYTPVLDAIGNSIIQKEGTFKILRAPTSVEEMIVRVLHKDGTSFDIPTSKFTVDAVARTLSITDVNVILNFRTGDQILINYEPKTVF